MTSDELQAEVLRLRSELAEEREERKRMGRALEDAMAAVRAAADDRKALEARRSADRERKAAQHPGVPMPPPEGVDVGPPLVRLLTLEEQAQRRAECDEQARIYRAEAEERRRLKARRWIYFMQERGNVAAPVKIGISRDVERRRNELQRAERVILSCLASFEGTIKDEQAMHARFAAHRLHGEWFSPAPELLSHIAALNGVKQ